MPKFRDRRAAELYAELTSQTRVFQQQPGDVLPELVLHVSEGCNLACKYCFADEGKYGAAHSIFMTESAARRAVDRAVEAYRGIGKIKFFGGEPLLNVKAIRAAAERLAHHVDAGRLEKLPEFVTISNMTVTHAQAVNAVRELGIRITGSIDGPPEIHDAMRVFQSGKGSFAQVDAGIKTYLELGQPECLEVVYSALHVKAGMSMIDVHEWLVDRYGIHAIIMHPMKPMPGVRDLDWADFNERIFDLSRDYGRFCAQQALERHDVLLTRHLVGRMISKERGDQHCGLGVQTLTVTAGESIYPCYMFIGQEGFEMAPPSAEGNFRSSPTFKPIQQMFVDNRKSQNPVCRDCDVVKTCQMCPGSFYHGAGGIDKPLEWACDYRIGTDEGVLVGVLDVWDRPDGEALIGAAMDSVWAD